MSLFAQKHDNCPTCRCIEPLPRADLAPQPSVSMAAVSALASYQQADMEGVMVLVSRQAIEECLPALRAIVGKDG